MGRGHEGRSAARHQHRARHTARPVTGRPLTACRIPGSCSLRLGLSGYAGSAWKPASSERQRTPDDRAGSSGEGLGSKGQPGPRRTWLPGALGTRISERLVKLQIPSRELRKRPRHTLARDHQARRENARTPHSSRFHRQPAGASV